MRKKLFAVIMSAMMMITFMPTMAFAAATPITIDPTAVGTTVDWDDAYASATVTTGSTTITVNADKAFQAGGTTKSTLQTAGLSGSTVYDITWTGGAPVKEFYDLNGAKIVRVVSGIEVPFTIGADTYFGMIDQSVKWKGPQFGLKTAPSTYYNIFDLLGGTEGKVKVADPTKTTLTSTDYVNVDTANILAAADFEQVLPAYEKYQESKNYDVTVTATAKASATTPVINADKLVSAYQVYIDSSAFASVGLKIDGSSKESNDVELAASIPSAADSINTTYTGSAQNIEVVTKGLNVQYSVDNGKTWTATAPEVKNITTTPVKFAIKATNDKNVSKYGKVTVTVAPAVAGFSLKKKTFNFAPKTEVKASDLVEFVAYENLSPFDATKKVTMSDEIKTTAKEFIDKFVVMKGLDLDAPENDVTFYLDQVALAKAEKESEAIYNFCEKYLAWNEALGTNDELLDVTATTTTKLETKVNFGLYINDVTAKNKTVTYKAKNGKLAKTKKVTLKATADFGTLSFTKMNTKGGSKIAVAKSGKVTIKKGLKKGTYKVKVKVKAPGAKANMYLTVKVK